MPKNLTDVEVFTDPVSVPVGTDVRNAASVETPFQALANRTYRNSQLLTKNPGEITLPATVLLPPRFLLAASVAAGGVNLGSSASQFNLTDSGGIQTLLAETGADRVFFDITPFLGRSESIVRVRVLVNPGASRPTVGNRMTSVLKSVDYGGLFGSPSGPTATTVGTETDDGVAGLQWITHDLSGSPVTVSSEHAWFIDFTTGTATASEVDSIFAIALEVQTDRIGNF